MAWTTPSTAVAGSTALTAAFWNEQVRDNTNFLYTPPMCRVYRSTNLTGYTSFTEITWDAEDFDTDSMWSSGTDITINTPGVYLATTNLYVIAASGTMTRVGCAILYNGSLRSLANYPVESADAAYVEKSDVFNLSAGDTISAAAYITGGSTYSIGANVPENHTTSRLSVVWIGKA